MATRFIDRKSGTGTMKVRPGATPIQYDTSDDKLKFKDDNDSTVRSVVSEDQTQTLSGKTLTSPVLNTPTTTEAVEAVAAAGSAQGDATAITAGSGAIIHATGADGTKGIKLPAAAAGKKYYIKNADAANAILKVYPATGDKINAGAADAALSMAAKTAAVFCCIDGTDWFTISLLPS